MMDTAMMIDRIRLRHLRTLATIAEHATLVQAASAMSVTQSAVTKTLAELEDIVGQRLVERTRQGVRLTNTGQILLRYVGSSIRTLREGLNSACSNNSSDNPLIEIGTLPNVRATILPQAIAQCTRDMPHVFVSVHSGSNERLLAQLRQGELDIVIGPAGNSTDMKGLSFEKLYEESVVFAVRPHHPLLVQTRLSPAMLMQSRIILPNRGTCLRAPTEKFFISNGLPLPDSLIETYDPMFARSFLLHTDSVWCTPAGAVENDVREGTLALLPINTAGIVLEVGITVRADSVPSDVMQQMLHRIRETINDA